MTHPQRCELLDIRHRPNGDVVIKRYPFETVFNKEEWEELTNYCTSHSSAPSNKSPCDDCPHELDKYSNPCPVTTGELPECDQFKCKICVAHCGDEQSIRQDEREKVLDDIKEKIGNTIEELNFNDIDESGLNRALNIIESLRELRKQEQP